MSWLCLHLKKGYWLFLAVWLWTTPLMAQPDIRLLVDISGSMKQTDPNNLRIPAASLLLDILPESAAAGIWTFGSQTNRLVAHRSVSDTWKQTARRQVQQISSVALHTDIEQALQVASWDRQQNDKPRHLILLSDGMIDLVNQADDPEAAAMNQASRDRVLRQLAPQLIQAGFVIHTLALSDQADMDLMMTLAQRSGGLHAVAHTAEDLLPLLLQILNRAMPAEEVPLQNNRFMIDALVDEFTALVFHLPGDDLALVTPDGERYAASSSPSRVRWHTTDRYTLITVDAPQSGEWEIITQEHPDNRVTVVSDLQLQSSGFPATVFRGFPELSQTVSVWLTEDGQVIDRREFLRLLQAAAVHEAETVKRYPLNLVDEGYRYEGTLTDFAQLGEQQLRLEVDGHTFRRQLNYYFTVQDVVGATLQMPNDGSAPRIILRAQHPEIRPSEIDFRFTAATALTAVYRDDGEWQVDLSALDRSQDQTLVVEVIGSMRGEPLAIRLPELLLPADPALVPPLVVQPAPMPQPAVAESLPPVSEPEPALTETASQPGWLDPLTDWDDPRLPWIYAGLAGFNLLLLLLAWLGYRRFRQQRRMRRTGSA